MDNEDKYWRTYYIIQELLATEYIDRYNQSADRDIRLEFTLPPKLNKDAEKIARMIHDEKTF